MIGSHRQFRCMPHLANTHALSNLRSMRDRSLSGAIAFAGIDGKIPYIPDDWIGQAEWTSLALLASFRFSMDFVDQFGRHPLSFGKSEMGIYGIIPCLNAE